MSHVPKIMGKDLYLSPSQPEDFEVFARWLSDPAVSDGVGCTATLFTGDKAREVLLPACNTGQCFSIISREDDRLIGNIRLVEVDHLSRRATVGMFIGDAQNRGRGYGTQALRALLRYAFGVLNLSNIMLNVFSFNTGGLGCYKKVGFKMIGARRQCKYLNGAYHDMLYMDILPEDFIDE